MKRNSYVTLVHDNGDVKIAKVVSAYRTSLDVVFSLCGSYRIDLRNGALRVDSRWKLLDVEGARVAAREFRGYPVSHDD